MICSKLSSIASSGEEACVAFGYHVNKRVSYSPLFLYRFSSENPIEEFELEQGAKCYDGVPSSSLLGTAVLSKRGDLHDTFFSLILQMIFFILFLINIGDIST